MSFFVSFMDLALYEAKQAFLRNEVPVGAVLVVQGEVIARAGNSMREYKDPTAHAEILVLREGARLLDSQHLRKADLYVTLEPCTMCAGAISLARIRRLYFGASDKKAGAILNGIGFFHSSNCLHKPDFYAGFCEQESASLLKEFFSSRRS